MQTMGQMVVQYQSKNRDGGNFVENTYGKNGEFNFLLQKRPNPIMTARQCLRIYRLCRWRLPRGTVALYGGGLRLYA